MYITAVIPAAGRGVRLKNRVSKSLVNIAQRPLLAHTLAVINKHPLIDDVIVVVNILDISKIKKVISQYKLKKVKGIVLGGSRRQDSVRLGLQSIPERTDFVLIHDGARPFVTKAIISRVINEAKKTGAAIAGVPVKATIKKIQNRKTFLVEKTIDRSDLWEAQTPQVFRRDLILRAYEKFGGVDVTDDAMLVERLGTRVNVVLGSCTNIKITTPEDLTMAEAILKAQSAKRKAQN